MEERRVLKRFNLRLPTRMVLTGCDPKKELFNLLTRDISSNGAYFPTMKPLPKGKRVKIELLLTHEKLDISAKPSYIKLNGTVLRSEPRGMAIRFDNEYEITPICGPYGVRKHFF